MSPEETLAAILAQIDPDRIYRAGEIAAILQCQTNEVSNAVKRAGLRYPGVGVLCRVKGEHVIAMLAERGFGPKAAATPSTRKRDRAELEAMR